MSYAKGMEMNQLATFYKANRLRVKIAAGFAAFSVIACFADASNKQSLRSVAPIPTPVTTITPTSSTLSETPDKFIESKEKCQTAREDLARAKRDLGNYEGGAWASSVDTNSWAGNADRSIYEKEIKQAEDILYYCKR